MKLIKKLKILKMLWNTLYKAMETYCVSCKKNTTNENSSVRRSKQNRLTLLLNCAICGKKRSNLHSFVARKQIYACIAFKTATV